MEDQGNLPREAARPETNWMRLGRAGLARLGLEIKLLHLNIFEISFGPGGPLLGEAPSQRVIG